MLRADEHGSRHFGAALPTDQLASALARLDDASIEWIEAPALDPTGRLNGKTSAKFADPSGNVIELKAYPHGRADIVVD